MLVYFKEILKYDRFIIFILIYSILFGLLVGISEIFFAFSLKELLVHFNIIDSKSNFSLLFQLNPIFLFITVVIIRAAFSSGAYFLQIYLSSYFKFSVRSFVINYLYIEKGISKLSLKNMSTLMSEVSEKGGFCLHHLSSMFSQLFLIFINFMFLLYMSFKLTFLSLITLSIFGVFFFNL